MKEIRILVLGSKEYPLGTNKGDDPLPSGGIEVYINRLIKELNKEGITIKVITRKFKGAKEHEEIGSAEVHRVSWIRGFYFRNVSFNFFSFLKSLWLGFDIIYANDVFATFIGVFLSKIKRKPLLSLVHGTAFDQPQYNVILRGALKELERFTYSHADCIVFLSEKVKENFKQKHGFLPESWKVIPIGVDPEVFERASSYKIKDEFKLEKGIPVITFIGRLIRVKGAEYLIEAAAKIKASKFLVLIVGSGLEEEKLKRRVYELNLKDKIIFSGFREDIPDILAATDIYVLPSVSEGLSISLLEAKASGRACIVTDIGLPVKNGETALVVPPANSEALANAIEKLIGDKEVRDKLGKNAKEEVLKKYSWERAAEEYVETFEELLLRYKR